MNSMSETKRRYDTSNRPRRYTGRQIATRFSDETTARIRRVAEERRWSETATVRNIVEDHFDREETITR